MAGETKNHRVRMRVQQSGRVADGNALKTSAMVQEFAKRDCELFDAGSTGIRNDKENPNWDVRGRGFILNKHGLRVYRRFILACFISHARLKNE